MKKAALLLIGYILLFNIIFCKICFAAENNGSIVPIISYLLLSNKSQKDNTEIIIGDDGAISAFKGKTLYSKIFIYKDLLIDDGENYTYILREGPINLSISPTGVIEYNIDESAVTEFFPIEIDICSKSTGKIYTATATIFIMETTIEISGTIDSEGGSISNQWGDVILTVPPDTVNEPALFQVLRGIDPNGYYAYTIKTSAKIHTSLPLQLPDPVLRKAPVPPESAQSQDMLISEEHELDRVEQSAEEISWDTMRRWCFWAADFVKIEIGMNAENRLATGVPRPSHDRISVHSKVSAELYSLCSEANYQQECNGRTPVLFIHGYSPAFVGWRDPETGGGESTWGDLPIHIAKAGYAVFEFRWRTNARFIDAAADFESAIKKIERKSGKKVHIIAHSMGGLLSRTYLQGLSVNRSYGNNVQSLVTIGTPHSGIFPESFQDQDGNYWFDGQDGSLMFSQCMQVSCHQAGQKTEDAFTIDPWFTGEDEVYAGEWFDIDPDKPGEIIFDLNATKNEIPVDTLVLMGLRRISNQLFVDTYSDGDGLITFSGQRFDPSWHNDPIHQSSVFFFR